MSHPLDDWRKIAPLAKAVDVLAGPLPVDDEPDRFATPLDLFGEAHNEPVAIAPLLPVVRAARLVGYLAAGDDSVDVHAIADVVARHPWLLQRAPDDTSPVVLVDDIDDTVTIRRHRAGRLLFDALILGLESHKLRWGMRPIPSHLKTAFADADQARAVLGAVAALPVEIAAQPLAPAAFCKAPTFRHDRQVHVVVGPLVHHLLAMCSPAVRRLRVDLALLGRVAGVIDDDDVYRGLTLLDAREPRCRAERRLQDIDEGVVDDGRFVLIDPLKLSEDLVDRRLRSLLAPLKRARALIAAVADDIDIDQALAMTPASVQVVVGGTGMRPTPWLVAAATGAVHPGNDEEVVASLSIPSPLLAPEYGDVDDGAFALVQTLARAKMVMPLPSTRLHLGDDASSLCAAAVAAMVPVTTGF